MNRQEFIDEVDSLLNMVVNNTDEEVNGAILLITQNGNPYSISAGYGMDKFQAARLLNETADKLMQQAVKPMINELMQEHDKPPNNN